MDLNQPQTLYETDYEKDKVFPGERAEAPPATPGLAFTDNKIWIGQRSDNSNGVTDPDLTHYRKIDATGPGTYAVSDSKQCGGFR
ncbi:hypothetical protein DL767_001597 [Monosporascus sp. MG133]|nr:hypothetical protein DL767_001597 [Monosporascus sp. MG133]